MKTLIFKLTTLVAMGMSVFVPRVLAGCATGWEVPRDHFDGVDEHGYVSYWDKIAEIDIGEDKPFPIVIGFNSNRKSSSPYLGYGWVMPLLESSVVQTGENTFEIMKPTGYTSGFGRDPKNSFEIGGVKGWRGEVGADSIKVWAPCGWSLTYSRGKLSELRTPKGKRIVLKRGTDGLVEDVTIDGQVLLKVLAGFGGQMQTLEVGGVRLSVVLSEKPKVHNVQGKNLIVGKDLSLSRVEDPKAEGGKRKTFEYGLDKTLNPSVSLKVGNDLSRHIVWSADTDHILSDNEWAYKIQTPEAAAQNVAVTRTLPDSRSEFRHEDIANGRLVQRFLDGTEKVETWFTSGDFSGKKRSFTLSKPSVGRSAEKIVQTERWSYDELGRVNRIVFASPGSSETSVSYQYDHDGVTVKKIGSDKDRTIRFDREGKITIVKNDNGEIIKIGDLVRKLAAETTR